jgi:hypothetical protein
MGQWHGGFFNQQRADLAGQQAVRQKGEALVDHAHGNIGTAGQVNRRIACAPLSHAMHDQA